MEITDKDVDGVVDSLQELLLARRTLMLTWAFSKPTDQTILEPIIDDINRLIIKGLLVLCKIINIDQEER